MLTMLSMMALRVVCFSYFKDFFGKCYFVVRLFCCRVGCPPFDSFLFGSGTIGKCFKSGDFLRRQTTEFFGF